MKMSSTYLMLLLQYIYLLYLLLNDQQRAKFGLRMSASAVMLCTTYYKIADLAMVIKVGFFKPFMRSKC